VKLLLVRHGETEWNKLGKFQGHCDIALNARGLAQARETAQAVVTWQHSAVYASPLCRTMRVAEEISQAGGKPVVPVAGLKELGLGDLEGVTGEEMRAGWPEIYAAWREDPGSVAMPNGESLAQLQSRAWEAVTALEIAHAQDEALVIVSHNFAIRTIIGKLLGMPLSNFHRMSLSLASISVVECDQRGRRLLSYNSTCHLSPENR
jgi:broad specificity phosphatase PhoE